MRSQAVLSALLLALEPVAAVWPVPVNFSKGTSYLFFSQNLAVTYNGAPLTFDPNHKPCRVSSTAVVGAAVDRAIKAITSENLVPWKLRPKNRLSEFEPALGSVKSVDSLTITQSEKDTPTTWKGRAGEVNESYNLTVSADGKAALSAVSAVGVLRGLETFVQLFYQHSSGNAAYTSYVPVAISDAPRYPHRGVLMDTARNWYEVKDILRTIDAMSWNKMNRLHIHATDSQSWPLDIKSMPEVARKGAHRADLFYSAKDIREIQLYGLYRGVQVYIEVGMPSHSGSIHHSHPELIAAYAAEPYHWYCAQPPCGALKLNDSRVDDFLDKMLDDVLPRVSPFTSYWHTGGDELNANASTLDESVGNTNDPKVLQPLLQRFIDARHSRIRKHGLSPLVWEEMPLHWNITLGNDTVVQAWLGGTSVSDLTKKGLRVIDSNYNAWYLDCGRGQWLNFENGAAYNQFYPFNDWCGPAKSWRLVYSHDPAAGLPAEQAKLVLGGEVAVWSESIDPQSLDSIVWPRASAAGEVLWSGRNDSAGVQRSQMDASLRINEMRERMVVRGVRAAALTQLWCNQENRSESCAMLV